MDKLLTIFTPTYNRKDKLIRLYNSLCNQTNKGFKWLIIDDGSTDETKELIDLFIEESNILIEYYFQNNSGKMKAHNKAVKICDTPLFLCVDSDDYLIKNAVDIILKVMSKKRMDDEKIIGMLAYKTSEREILVEDKNIGVETLNQLTLQELYKNKYSGETTLVFKTEVIKKYPFVIYEGEKFIQEKTVYDLLDKVGKYIILPENLTIFEYQKDGYTNNIRNIMVNNPKGAFHYFNEAIKSEQSKLRNFKNIVNAVAYGFLANYKWKSIFKEYRLYKAILSPIAFYIYLKRKKLRNQQNILDII